MFIVDSLKSPKLISRKIRSTLWFFFQLWTISEIKGRKSNFVAAKFVKIVSFWRLLLISSKLTSRKIVWNDSYLIERFWFLSNGRRHYCARVRLVQASKVSYEHILRKILWIFTSKRIQTRFVFTKMTHFKPVLFFAKHWAINWEISVADIWNGQKLWKRAKFISRPKLIRSGGSIPMQGTT